MKKLALCTALSLAAASAPAHATGGLSCKTAGPNPIRIDLGFGHAPSAGLFLAKLTVEGREFAVDAPQWWMRGSELRLAMTSMASGDHEAILIAQWNDETRAYDGTLTRNGKKRWIRCREA